MSTRTHRQSWQKRLAMTMRLGGEAVAAEAWSEPLCLRGRIANHICVATDARIQRSSLHLHWVNVCGKHSQQRQQP